MIALQEARSFVLGACKVLPSGNVPIDDALGCVAAESVVAREPVPPFANSAKDGYALRSVDTVDALRSKAPVRLDVVRSIMAGAALDVHIGPRQAARIMTGAPLPHGADVVCMLEDARNESCGSVVLIDRPFSAGESVRPAGEDVSVGQKILDIGDQITPGHIGVLAGQGLGHVDVFRVPRMGILSTGDELAPDLGPLSSGKIRDSNRHSLLALVRREGWNAVDLGIVGDDEAQITGTLDAAVVVCDAIVTSGGVSVGDLDVVKHVLQERSRGMFRQMQVAIQPGKPFAFGLSGAKETPVFALPGNPVSAMVSFELFVRPAGRLMAGHRVLARPIARAIAEANFEREPDGKTHFRRASLHLDNEGRWRVRPLSGQDSHRLLTMAQSNCLVVLPNGRGVPVGCWVRVMLTDPERIGVAEKTTGGAGP
jgi:molybdenum cofactor synthesis domain-containing protein